MKSTYKRCTKCNKLQPLKEFNLQRGGKYGRRSRCRKCVAKYDKQPHIQKRKLNYFHNNKRWFKDYWLKRDHGITIEEYEAIGKSQGWVCAICKKRGKAKGLVVDHSHQTGKIRGLLCSACNLFLGRIDDDKTLLNASLEYLASHS